MSEFYEGVTPEVKLYPGVIDETIKESLGEVALFSLVDVEGV